MWTSLLIGCVLALGRPALSVDTLYRKEGNDVILQPVKLPPSKKSITWKDGENIAVEWDGQTIEYFRQYKGRSSLDVASAAFTIRGLTPNDSTSYLLLINDNHIVTINLVVISPVPVPTISQECNEESCLLTCDGDTSGAEPVTYTWRSGDTVLPNPTQVLRITKENTSSEFICDLKNPVSLESSPSVPNPFISDSDGPKISVGLTVFISLLVVLLLLVLVHRWKAGMWFFQKESMPWAAEFWSKEESWQKNSAQSNREPSVRMFEEQMDSEAVACGE